MDDGFQLYGILLFAVVAGVLLVRLWSVLGKRTGTERRIDPFAPPPPRPPGGPSPFAPGAAKGPVIEGQAVRVDAAPDASGKVPGASAAKAADPGFNEPDFLKGARAAVSIVGDGFPNGGRASFSSVVTACAAGDTSTLRPLLSPEVFEQFASAIRARAPGKEKE